MLPAFLLLAALPAWIPARWHSIDPRSLDLLSGTPVNCVLLEEPLWNPAFLQEAGKRNIATLGVVHPGAELPQQARRAAGLQMNGVVLEGEIDPADAQQLRAALTGSGTKGIELPSLRGIRLGISIETSGPIVGTWQGVWPCIEIEYAGGTAAGPTSSPWVHTNTGFLRFLRAASDAPVWIGVSPRPHTAYPPERYLQAICDAALAGARWILEFDEDLRGRLLRGEPQAVQTWQRAARYLRYFEDHREWLDFRPFSRFGVVEDASTGALLAGGLLDMLASQRTTQRVIPTRRVSPEALRGIRVLLNVDPDSMSASQRRAIEDFVRAGGELVSPPAKWRFPPLSEQQVVLTRQQAGELQDLWELIYNATARKNFGARTFNTAGMLSSVLAAPDGKSLLVHLLNYTDFPVESITVQVLGTWKRARLYSPEAPPQELPVYPVKDGTGVDIERIAVLATIRLD
ncbi:MAG: hypothetical protein HY238_25020 [Acidobacteria bacterium]|nr:hypothetical protein [Acidobacteriota bacterium]